MANEIGAAIHIPPNASRILLGWDMDPNRAMFDKARVVSYHSFSESLSSGYEEAGMIHGGIALLQ